MFGFRPDGRRLSNIDPIVGLTPYLMPKRNDAMVNVPLQVDCDTLTRYIRQQRDKGHVISYLDLVVAGYVRTIAQFPELNRFIANKQLYARNSICVSMTVLKQTGTDELLETTIKPHFDPRDTLFDVHAKLQAAIDENRRMEMVNDTDAIARLLLKTPGLPTTVVSLVRLLDRVGILPRFLLNASPFHTGMFLTNMASLGMPYVYHHIYNFGTTSLFVARGKVERVPLPGPDGQVIFKRVIPLGVVVDERITSGASYGQAFGYWRDLLADPCQLETPPESVRYDIEPEEKTASRKKSRRARRTLSA